MHTNIFIFVFIKFQAFSTLKKKVHFLSGKDLGWGGGNTYFWCVFLYLEILSSKYQKVFHFLWSQYAGASCRHHSICRTHAVRCPWHTLENAISLYIEGTFLNPTPVFSPNRTLIGPHYKTIKYSTNESMVFIQMYIVYLIYFADKATCTYYVIQIQLIYFCSFSRSFDRAEIY